MYRFMRKTTKLTVLAGGGVGSYALAITFVNDNLDDIPYAIKRMVYRYPKPEERKKVVVLGSGWGATSFIKKLDPALYDVTVASPRPFFFYTPLLCGSTTGMVSPGSIIEPVRDVNRSVNYLNVSCKDVDLQSKKVYCAGGNPDGPSVTLDYDHLVISVGAQPNTFGIPGVDKYGMFLKEMEHGRAVRQKLLNNIEQADVAQVSGDTELMKKLLTIVVVGGGPTGVEFCGELSDFINKDIRRQYPKLEGHFRVVLVEALPGILAMFKKDVGEHVVSHLSDQCVEVRVNAMVKECEKDKVHLKLKDGIQTIDYGMLVWVAGVGLRPFTKALCEKIGKEAGQTDKRGLLVDECLRVRGTPPGEVFAIGDCAVSGKPPTAQVAMQQGKYLGRMFRKDAKTSLADPAAPHFTFHNKGTMAYIGDAKAAAEIQPSGILRLGKGKLSDYHFWRSLYGEDDEIKVQGWSAFAIWRHTYWSSMFSSRGQWGVAMDWTRASLFGRPASSSAQGTSVSV